MRVAIPINQRDIKSEVYPSFGRAPYYLMYETNDRTSIFLDNTAALSAGGAGIKAAQLLLDNDVKVIIAPRYGENAAKVLADANVVVYKNIVGSAEDNIKAYENKELNVLADIHSGHHSNGK
ncbi:MAG: NifB/NifX family molybdenum-iron cluster-binding protein [Clostridia bacterium]